MSNTFKHKDLGRWKNGAGNITERLNNLFDRHNFEVGERRARRIDKKVKILNKLEDDEIFDNYYSYDGWFMWYR